MNDLNEQYKIELKLQEKKSNVRTLKSFLWFFIAMVVIWVLTAVDFFCYRYEVGDNCLFNIDCFFCYSADSVYKR